MLQHMPLGQFGSLEKFYVIFKNLELTIYFQDEQEVDKPLERGLAVFTTRAFLRVTPRAVAGMPGSDSLLRSEETGDAVPWPLRCSE